MATDGVGAAVDNRRDKGSVALWVVVGSCVAYLLLWVCGVRFPRPAPPAAAVEIEVIELEDEGDEVERGSISDEEFDVELPSDPEFVDDGRDYHAPLL